VDGSPDQLQIAYRALLATDSDELQRMLYLALCTPIGKASPPRDVVQRPELARYVTSWGRQGDAGVAATLDASGHMIGAAWHRL
jgi:hypothetical protein